MTYGNGSWSHGTAMDVVGNDELDPKMREYLFEDKLKTEYSSYKDLIKGSPKLRKEGFAAFKETLKNKKNTSESLAYAYQLLGDLVKEKPTLAKQVLDTIVVGMELRYWKDYNRYSLKEAFQALTNVVKADPTLVKQTTEILEEYVPEDDNRASSVYAWEILSQTIERIKNPKGKGLVDFLASKASRLDEVSKRVRAYQFTQSKAKKNGGLTGKALHDAEQKARLKVSKAILKQRQTTK